jgi:uncharacterized protein YjdB
MVPDTVFFHNFGIPLYSGEEKRVKSRPSILIAAIFGILPILSCTNPIIEEFFARDKGQNKPPNDPEIITVSGVSLNTNELELTIDGSTTLTALVQPDNATNRTVTWSSSDDTVAAVDDGLVTALAEGTATITVTAIDGGHTASCEVTVEAVAPDTVAVTGVSLNTKKLTLPVGETETLSAEIEPGNATNQTVNWTSTNTGVATVDVATGLVTALGEGSATITVTTVSGGKTASCEVTVFIPVTGVSLSTATLTLLVSETETLTAGVQPENATTQNVTWTSSDDLVAAVNSGIITALSAGDATITVTTVDGNHSATCTVTVRESTGETDAPFLIYNELELRQVGTTDSWNLSVHYKLMADITLTQGDWTPIGDNSSRSATTSFTGSFDGNNKTITGINIDKPNADYQGMFGYIGLGGEVKDLTLLDCNVYGKDNVGGMAGIMGKATVINCRIVGNVSGTEIVGGVVGYTIGIVENCYTKGDINGNDIVGGVAGYSIGGTITNCNVEGVVSGDNRVGGVVGGNNGTVTNCNVEGVVSGIEMVGGVAGSNTGTMYNCNATGNVNGTSNYVGGVTGYNNGRTTVYNCNATGDINGKNYVGGVAGFNHSTGTVNNSYVTGNISGNENVGGIVGRNEGTITNCNAEGDVNGNGYVAGVAGYSTGTVENCNTTGNVDGTGNRVGGVAGQNTGTVENCCVAGTVSGNEYVGGVAGWSGLGGVGAVLNSRVTGNVSGNISVGGVVGNSQGPVENCYATGYVIGNSSVGGLAGSMGWSSINNKGTITNSYAEGIVSGGSSVGGVVGYNNRNSTVINCYATGYVYGTARRVGGVVGENAGTVENSHATGDVRGDSSVGGVAGENAGTVENSYATGDVRGDGHSVGGVVGWNIAGLTTNCYATGNVSGSGSVGGVVGNIYNSTSTVINCYATGNVSGQGTVGGVAGYCKDGTVKNCVALNPNINSRDNPFGRIGNGGTMTNNYGRKDMKVLNGKMIWTNDISGEDGADITAADYQLQSWWSGSAGFDFGATWEWDNAGQLPVLYSDI